MVGARLEGQAILDRLAASVPEEIRRRLPPPCLLDMQAEPVEYVAACDRGQGPEPESHAFVCNCQESLSY